MKGRQQSVGRREVIVSGFGALTTLLAACASTSGGNDTAVALTYTKKGRLTGSFSGRHVDLTSQLPTSSGMVRGTVAQEPVDANWRIAHDGTSGQTVLPVSLHGTFARQSVLLNAIFRLKPNFLFDSGTATGTVDGRAVHAQASSAPGESSSSVNVDGSFAGETLSLYATIAGDLRSALIRGTVGGKPTYLTARVQSGAIHINGSYSGPSDLFVLMAGSLIYFLGGIYA